MASPVSGFECLRRLLAAPFEWLTPFEGFAVYRFLWLRRLTSLRASPFYACGV